MRGNKTGFLGWLAARLVLSVGLLGGGSALAETVTYFHNDIAGTPIAASDASGNVIWKENYQPFGGRMNNLPASGSNDQWFAGKPVETATGLSYFGARYYDPALGRFMGIDPKEVDPNNLHSFNRYGYGNNNPFRYKDPDGKAPTAIVGGEAGFLVCGLPCGVVGAIVGGLGGAWIANKAWNSLHSESTDGAGTTASEGESGNKAGTGGSGADSENANPYKGAVDKPIVVVDSKGNAIPVAKGQQINTSPNGDYQQVIGADGKPTGDRMDRGGHRGQSDPRAQRPHAHRPGVTMSDGNTHLPIN